MRSPSSPPVDGRLLWSVVRVTCHVRNASSRQSNNESGSSNVKDMTSDVNTIAGCQIVGNYVDEGDCLTTSSFHRAEVVRPQIVANVIDNWGPDEGMRNFTVLLKDGRMVHARGHGLKHEPHPLAGQDVFSIVVRTETEEALIAFFKSADIDGISYGDVNPARKIA